MKQNKSECPVSLLSIFNQAMKQWFHNSHSILSLFVTCLQTLLDGKNCACVCMADEYFEANLTVGRSHTGSSEHRYG